MTTDQRLDVRTEQSVPLDELLALYGAVGWSVYADQPDVLAAAVAGSHLVLAARLDGELVGLARTVSDGASICYVQDLLVHPDARRRGVARALMTEVLERYAHCRQFVLITDRDGPGVHAFYRSVGLMDGDEAGATVFLRRR